MKKIYTLMTMLIFSTMDAQEDYKIVLKSEDYTINKTHYGQAATLFTLNDTDINVKPIGNLKLIKKAVSVKDTSVYFCDYNGKPVEVITVITKQRFKVTVRGSNVNYVIESDIQSSQSKNDLSKNDGLVAQ